MSTLAGSFVCGGPPGSPGGLIAYADSELGYGDLLKLPSSQSKWRFFLGPEVTIPMSGAGEWNYAQMALEEISTAFRTLGAEQQLTVPAVETIVKDVLVSIYDNNLRVVSPQPIFDVILGVRQADGSMGVIKSQGTAVTVRHGHEAIGSGSFVATCLADIFYRYDMSVKEGALLAAFILWASHRYSQGVGGKSTVLAITERIDVYEPAGLDSVFQDLLSALQISWSVITHPAAQEKEIHDMLTDQVNNAKKVREAFRDFTPTVEQWKLTKVGN